MASLGTSSGAWSSTTAPVGRGVVPVALGGMGLHALTASFSFAPLSFARDSRETRASNRAAGCSWGVPWGRGARVEVRKWWFGTTMSTDSTEGDIWTSRAQKKPTSTPPGVQVPRRSGSVPGTLALPPGGSGGRQRGLGGHVKFADRDLGGKWPRFFLFVRNSGPISSRIGPFPPSLRST